MNKNPFCLKVGFSTKEAKGLMINERLDCLPVLDENNKIVSAIWWLDLFKDGKKEYASINLPVVIMAGGEGTRLAPYTNILPKPLIPINETPIIEIIIQKFAKYGCNDFYLSVNYKSSLIRAYFNDYSDGHNIEFIEEETPLGTAGSLYLLKDKINKTFFLSNCDIIVDEDYSKIYDFHKSNENKITIISSMKHYQIPYGICEIGNDGYLKKIKEKPEYDFLANTGLYLLEPEIIDEIPSNQHCNFPEIINRAIRSNNKIGIFPISEKSWLDMGELEALQNTIKRFSDK